MMAPAILPTPMKAIVRMGYENLALKIALSHSIARICDLDMNNRGLFDIFLEVFLLWRSIHSFSSEAGGSSSLLGSVTVMAVPSSRGW